MRDWYYVNSQGNSPRECALLVVLVPSGGSMGNQSTSFDLGNARPAVPGNYPPSGSPGNPPGSRTQTRAGTPRRCAALSAPRCGCRLGLGFKVRVVRAHLNRRCGVRHVRENRYGVERLGLSTSVVHSHLRPFPVAHNPMNLVILNMCVTSEASTSLSCCLWRWGWVRLNRFGFKEASRDEICTHFILTCVKKVRTSEIRSGRQPKVTLHVPESSSASPRTRCPCLARRLRLCPLI